MKNEKKMKNWEIQEEKTRYLIQCFIPKARNVSNDKSTWMTCHKFKYFGRAEKAYLNRVKTQPTDKWRILKVTSVTKTTNRVFAQSDSH